MVIVEFSIVPLGTGSTSLSEYVTEACRIVKESGFHFMITPMGTIMETGTLSEAFRVIQEAHEAVLKKGASRVSTTIKVDDRRDVVRSMEDKMRKIKL